MGSNANRRVKAWASNGLQISVDSKNHGYFSSFFFQVVHASSASPAAPSTQRPATARRSRPNLSLSAASAAPPPSPPRPKSYLSASSPLWSSPCRRCGRRDGEAVWQRRQEAASLPLPRRVILVVVQLQALPPVPPPPIPPQAAPRAAGAAFRREEAEEGASPAVDEDGSVGRLRGIHVRQGIRRGTLRGAHARTPRHRAPSLPLPHYPR